MGKRHGYAQRQVRADLRSFIRHNVRVFLGLAGFFVPLVVWTLVMTGGWLQGFILGIIASWYTAILGMLFVAVTGSMNRIVGSWGEDNTRSELRRAKRRRHILGWVDNLEIESGDVDHLVLLADGRYVAIDSKWHGVEMTEQATREAARLGALNARRASLILRAIKAAPDVVPLVVCWGAARDELQGTPRRVGDVDIISGSDLRTWVATAAGTARMDRSTGLAQLAELERFKDRVRPDRARRVPTGPSKEPRANPVPG